MASIVKDAFQDLRRHVESVISRLFESEPNQSELICDEIHAFSAKLDSIRACYLVQNSAVSPAAETARNSLLSSHPVTQPVHEALHSSDQDSGFVSPAIAASNLFSRNQEPVDFPAYRTRRHSSLHDAISDADAHLPATSDGRNSIQTGEVPQLPADTPPRRNSMDRAESHQLLCDTTTFQQLSSCQAPREPNLGTQDRYLLGSRLQESSTAQESHQDQPFTQNQEQFPSYAENAPSANSPRSNENLTASITHEIQDGVIRLLPTAEQWHDFPTLLQYARDLGAEKVGICKVLLPVDVPGRTRSKPLNRVKQRGNKYLISPQDNGTFLIEEQEVNVLLQSEAGLPESSTNNSSSTKELVRRFEQLLETKHGLKDVTYCVDIDVRMEAERARIGLPKECPIWPLKGDRLCDTKVRVPGMHWPYYYESGKVYGAPFSIHQEDYRTISVNYLYEGGGEKVWITVEPEHSNLLEQKLKATNGSVYPFNCSQVLRHSPTYIPHTTLDEWGISYSLVRQKGYEAVITFPEAYHEGFSTGYTSAVAVNHADANWSFDSYRDCEPQSCPTGFIEREMLCLRGEDEEQRDQDEEMEEEDGYVAANEEESNDKANDARDNRRTKSSVVRTRIGHRVGQRADGVSSKQTSTIKGHKRKRSEQEPVVENSKQYKTRLPLKELQPIPQGIIQPTKVYQTFIDRSASAEENELWLLTRLFFAIASPDAFYQLRDACTVIRRRVDVTVPQHNNTIAQTIEALDNLEMTASTNGILRRYHLTCLVEYRNERENQHKIERPKRATRSLKCGHDSVGPVGKPVRQQEGFGRASSMALADIMAEAYPGQRTTSNTEYQRRYKSLKNRLCSGRNWHLMQQKFPPGILALVPTGGDYGIQNYEVEKLSVPLFTLFLDVLAELRGDFLHQVGGLVSQRIHDVLYRRDLSWKYVFEKMDGDSLKKEPLDSPGFIKFCGVE